VSADNPDFLRITKTQGRKAQEAAIKTPLPYNDETSEMLAWFDLEVKRRGFDVADNADESIGDALADQEAAQQARKERREAEGLPDGPPWQHPGNGHDRPGNAA
jgi:hypothetical protein